MFSRPHIFAFYRIHYFNLPLVILLRFFGKVAARTILVSFRFCKWVHLLEYDEPDSWNQALENAYQKVKTLIQEYANKPFLFKVSGKTIDLTKLLLQRLVREMEGGFVFLDLIARQKLASKTITVIPFQNEFFLKSRLVSLSLWRWIALFLDYIDGVVLQDFRFLCTVIIKGIRAMVFRSRLSLEQFTIFVGGNAPMELAEQDHQLDFSWWISTGLLDPLKTIFILPYKPNNKVQARLLTMQVQWISKREVLSLLSRVEIIWVLICSTVWFLMRIPYLRILNGFKFHLKVQSLTWFFIFRKSSIKLFVTSVGESWPEQAEVAVAQSLGARTLNWSCAGSYFSFTKNFKDFNDRLLFRSIIASDENWFWSQPTADVLEQRTLVQNGSRSSFISIGPMMCGDPSWLNLTAKEARLRYGNFDLDTFYLGVFDLPFYGRMMRSKIGYELGPYTSFEAQQKFFQGCIHVLKTIPELNMLLKLKRTNQNNLFELPDEFYQLVNPFNKWIKTGRVVLMNANVDPYIPIVMSDACITAPFSSSVIACDFLGKPAVFYDPTDVARNTFRGIFNELTLKTEEELIEWLRQTIKQRKLDPLFYEKIQSTSSKVYQSIIAKMQNRLKILSL